jgi:cytochrome c-type biogenesis protein CcmH
MIVFWISAALVSAAAAALIIHRAARAARIDGAEDPSLAVYRRQLAEIDDLAERGLLIEDERRSAHAEAARRLLAAADETAPPSPAPSRGGRLVIAVVAAAAPLAAIGLYLVVGSPQTPDQPFAKRLTAWRDAATHGRPLAPDQLAAVMQLIVSERPKDPKAYYFLAHAQMDAGDAFSAIGSLRQAIALAPRQAQLWIALGETYMAQAAGGPSADAVKAFEEALRLEPTAPMPRYDLGGAKIAGGDVDGGLAIWRALQNDLPATDPARPGLDQDIAVVEKTHALPQAAPTQPAAAAQGQQAFIRTMVGALAARLKASPDDPAGWARLIRSYAVLGDEPRRAAALAQARALFKSRPADLRTVEQASAAPQ